MNALAALLIALAPPAAQQKACMDLAQRETCEQAIAAAASDVDKALLHHRLGWAFNENEKPEQALQQLEISVRLDPENAEAWNELGYTLAELGEFDRALGALDAALKLRPNSHEALKERSYVRRRAGDFQGAWEDLDRVVALQPGDGAMLLARGYQALWLGRYSDAEKDSQAALAVAEKAGDAEAAAAARGQLKEIALWQADTGAPDPAERCRDAMKSGEMGAAGIIGDCTEAFFAARSNRDKAGLLTVRSLAWAVGEQDRRRWLADAEAAVAVDPDNGDWRANLGGVYNRLGRSAEALRELDRAVKMKDGYIARGARAAARYALGDAEGAFADAKKSFEMEPNVVALIVLGDLAFDAGNRDSAKLYWMGAYRMGDRDDGTRERLKKLGIEDPGKEPKA